MMMEVERQKYHRKLEQAQKELVDAMWRKKDQQRKVNVTLGLSMEPSIISESPIKHSDNSTVVSSMTVISTPYNRLAHGQVVDFLEQPAAVLTVPPYLRDKIENQPDAFDKYSRSHFDHLLSSCSNSIVSAASAGVRSSSLNQLLNGSKRSEAGEMHPNSLNPVQSLLKKSEHEVGSSTASRIGESLRMDRPCSPLSAFSTVSSPPGGSTSILELRKKKFGKSKHVERRASPSVRLSPMGRSCTEESFSRSLSLKEPKKDFKSYSQYKSLSESISDLSISNGGGTDALSFTVPISTTRTINPANQTKVSSADRSVLINKEGKLITGKPSTRFLEILLKPDV